MTIFLSVLKKLIKEQLGLLLEVQNGKINAKFLSYNVDLSKDQKTIISTLQDKIVRFDGTGDDLQDLNEILGFIDEARVQIQDARELHKQPRDAGETVTGFNNLRNHSMAFYDKLKNINKLKAKEPLKSADKTKPTEQGKKVNFNFLNRTYTRTPENTVYYHAALYFGDDIFNPKSTTNTDLREQKEVALLERLIQLKEWIQSEHALEDQRWRVIKVLKDLAGDNDSLTKGTSEKSFFPKISLFGGIASLSLEDMFSASPGRFGQEFSEAVRTVNKITEKEFNKPVVDTEALPKVVIPPKEEGEKTKTTNDKGDTKVKSTPPVRTVTKPKPTPKVVKQDQEEEEEIVIPQKSKATKKVKEQDDEAEVSITTRRTKPMPKAAKPDDEEELHETEETIPVSVQDEEINPGSDNEEETHHEEEEDNTSTYAM